MLKGKRILVTGGAGFIGSHLANALADENDVIVVDNGYLGVEENLDTIVDYRKRSVLESDLPTAVDVVFHLAAHPSYSTNERRLTDGTRVNVEGFVNVADQARRDGCETIVFTSTGSLYDGPLTSNSQKRPVAVNTGYEASKLAREKYGEYFANHYGMSVAGMRLLSPYHTHVGDDYRQAYANAITQFVDDIAHGRSPVLYGNGEQTRDFTHIDDTVRGLVVAAEHRLTGTYGLGTGRGVSFNELVEMIAEVLDRDVEPEYIERPISDATTVHDTVVGHSKLRTETGWEPQITLEEGIRRICSQYEVLSNA